MIGRIGFRIVALALFANAALPQEMTNFEARDICDEFARLDSASALDPFVVELSRQPTVTPTPAEQLLIKEQLFDPHVLDSVRLDIAPGRPILLLSVSDGGTCENYSIVPVTEPSAADSTGTVSEGDGPYLGGRDQIVRRDGRYFIINRDLRSGVLRDLAWITPAGAVQPMCSFSTEKIIRSVGIHRAPLALCTALLEAPSSVQWLKYEKFDVSNAAALKLLRDAASLTGLDENPEMEVTRVDVDNDGNVDDLLRLSYSNSAGCGSRGSRLQVLDAARNRIAADPMNNSLQMASFNGNPISIRSAGGRQFVLTDSDTEGGVYSIGRQGSEIQCSISHRRVMHVSRMFSDANAAAQR